jgi:eukaryotic-like serine/threonine-protein kinase
MQSGRPGISCLPRGSQNIADEERARLRDPARRWLRAEVAAWGEKIDSDPAAKESAENALKQWLTNPDLAGLREPELLEKLPVAESQACREMWREISAQIERASRRN